MRMTPEERQVTLKQIREDYLLTGIFIGSALMSFILNSLIIALILSYFAYTYYNGAEKTYNELEHEHDIDENNRTNVTYKQEKIKNG